MRFFVSHRDTERALVVILPESKVKDAALRIQHTLIEAFCRENDVKVLKVNLMSLLYLYIYIDCKRDLNRGPLCLMGLLCTIVCSRESNP